jgi:hypothetical protein
MEDARRDDQQPIGYGRKVVRHWITLASEWSGEQGKCQHEHRPMMEFYHKCELNVLGLRNRSNNPVAASNEKVAVGRTRTNPFMTPS